MKILALASVFFLLSACGGGSDTSNNDPSPQPTGWVTGQYDPSKNFANRCANPRSDSNYQDLVGTVTDENNWLRSWSHETYLWYSELPDINPASIANPVDYFERLKTSATTDSGKPKDRFHYAQNSEEYNQYTETGVSAGYGFTYALVQSTPPRKIVIIYSESNSPAANNNIRRGAEIINIDGQAVIDGDPDILNAGLIPSKLGEYHTFVIKDLSKPSARTVVLQSSEIVTVPVHTHKIINQSNKKIGYLALNTFFVASAEKQLINIINHFEDSQINELVLDLRYNGGGYITLSADLGTMIAGNTALGSIYTELAFNDKLSRENVMFRFAPTSSSDLSVASGTILPKLNLPQVYILSSNNTASASEYLINGLRGINVTVILIGTTTTGKPYGWQAEENCGTTYSTIQFKGQNAKDYGDFADGFIPSGDDNSEDQVRGCQVADDLSKALGDESENMLATALYYIKHGDCPTSGQSLASKPSHPLSAVRGTVVRPYPTGLILP